MGSLNQATAYESPAHSSTGTRSEPRAPPTAWELTVSCSISLPDGVEVGVTYLSALVSAAVVLWQGLDHLATYAFACLSADAYSFPHAFAGWLS